MRNAKGNLIDKGEIDYVFGSRETVSWSMTKALTKEFKVGSSYLSDHKPVVTQVTLAGP